MADVRKLLRQISGLGRNQRLAARPRGEFIEGGLIGLAQPDRIDGQPRRLRFINHISHIVRAALFLVRPNIRAIR